MVVVNLDVVFDRGFGFAGTAEGAAANLLLGQRSEPVFDAD